MEELVVEKAFYCWVQYNKAVLRKRNGLVKATLFRYRRVFRNVWGCIEISKTNRLSWS